METKIINYNTDYNELYECIDEFGLNMRTALLKPIKEGRPEEEVLQEVADKIWAYYQRNKLDGSFGTKKGTIKLKAKNLYDIGEWTLDGCLVLNIDEEHKDLKDYLKIRVSRFLYIAQEHHLLETLLSLGFNVREATLEEDISEKVDLYIKHNGKEYAVSVFRNTTEGWEAAEKKLRSSRPIEKKRVFFVFDDEGAKNPELVKAWIEKVVNENGYTWR